MKREEMRMKIFSLKKEEIQKALDLVWTVFLEFEAPDYTQQGIDEFKKFIDCKSMMDQINNGNLRFWGCKIQGELAGVIATRNRTHICLLFVKKEFHRRGIASKLFQTVKEDLRGHPITVNSSPYAIEVYHRLGFMDTDLEQTVNGMRFTPMSYQM
jgi:GNAT superfamily N-acetyltransferase